MQQKWLKKKGCNNCNFSDNSWASHSANVGLVVSHIPLIKHRKIRSRCFLFSRMTELPPAELHIHSWTRPCSCIESYANKGIELNNLWRNRFKCVGNYFFFFFFFCCCCWNFTSKPALQKGPPLSLNNGREELLIMLFPCVLYDNKHIYICLSI